METHHHSHSHGNRNWRSYLWEFLMLFLAVFCGFLAEYQLEHTIEHKKEKQYIETMIQDIVEDTAKLNTAIAYNAQKLSALDNLLKAIYDTPYTDSSLRMMYYYTRKYTGSRGDVVFTKRTITQLKYSGGLRLIRNRDASDSIVVYDENCERIERQGNVFANDYQFKARELSSKIFDSKYVLDYDRNNIDSFLVVKPKVSLLSNDQNLIKEYANWIYTLRGGLNNYLSLLRSHKIRANAIIEYLEKEY